MWASIKSGQIKQISILHVCMRYICLCASLHSILFAHLFPSRALILDAFFCFVFILMHTPVWKKRTLYFIVPWECVVLTILLGGFELLFYTHFIFTQQQTYRVNESEWEKEESTRKYFIISNTIIFEHPHIHLCCNSNNHK